MDWGEALTQAPYLVIVLVFVLYWTDRLSKSQDKRDADMRDFWKAQRDDDRKVMQELVNSVKALGEQLAEHDGHVDDRIEAARKPRGRT